MDDNKFTSKMKEGVSIHEVENFARRYTWEVFTILSIIIALISSKFDFFIGGAGWAVLFTAIGAIIGTLVPRPIEHGCKSCASFVRNQERITQLVLGILPIAVALFIPWVIFGIIGLMSGTAHDYFTHHAHNSSESMRSTPRGERPGGPSLHEHD